MAEGQPSCYVLRNFASYFPLPFPAILTPRVLRCFQHYDYNYGKVYSLSNSLSFSLPVCNGVISAMTQYTLQYVLQIKPIRIEKILKCVLFPKAHLGCAH